MMMQNYDESMEINHNTQIALIFLPSNPYEILIIGGSGYAKTNVRIYE